MFKNQRYLTRGVYSEIPIEPQLFMWECIDRLPKSVITFRYLSLKILTVYKESHIFQNSRNTKWNTYSPQSQNQLQQKYTSLMTETTQQCF